MPLSPARADLPQAPCLPADPRNNSRLDQVKVHQMGPVEGGPAIPPGGSVTLDPMGYHLLFTGMGQPFLDGQCVEIALHLATAGDLPIAPNIGGYGQKTPPDATKGVPVIRNCS